VWDLWSGNAQEIREGATCNLCINTSGSVDNIVAVGTIVSVDLPEFALIEITEPKEHPKGNALHYAMRWNLRRGKQVKQLIDYLFPMAEDETDCSPPKGRTFLTPVARERPGMQKRDWKLEPYKNIIFPCFRSLDQL
jgi:hypothetical protein